MDTKDIVFSIVYAVGIVLTPIVIGAFIGGVKKPGKVEEVIDIGIPMVLISLFWPFILLLVASFCLAIALLWLPGWIFMSLLSFGCKVGGDRIQSAFDRIRKRK